MHIPNEAVDAAYDAWWTANAYPSMDEGDASAALDEIRAHLEAGAPFIVAQELTSVAHLTFGPGPVRDEILRVVRDVYEVEP